MANHPNRNRPPARRAPGPRPRSRSEARQQTAIWGEMRSRRDWSAPEIAEACDCPLNTVQQYVAALARGAFVEQTAEPVATQGGAIPSRWRVIVTDDAAPIVTWSTRTARHQGEPTPSN